MHQHCNCAATVRTHVYKWLLQEFRPENQSTTDARNMVSTPRIVVRAYSGTSFHLSSQVSKPDTLTFGGALSMCGAS